MYKPRQKRIAAALALSAMLAGQLQAIPHAYATDDRDDDRGPHSRDEGRLHTATPIEHLIVAIPENRSYDHTYATYRPRHGQSVSYLLSKGIVKADGTPGEMKPEYRLPPMLYTAPRKLGLATAR